MLRELCQDHFEFTVDILCGLVFKSECDQAWQLLPTDCKKMAEAQVHSENDPTLTSSASKDKGII